MTHDLGQQQWIVGAVETDTYKKRFDIIIVRNQSNLEIFVKNHIEPGIKIVSDGWSGYRFLDNEDTSVLEHKLFNHGGGNFSRGQYSAIHIEHSCNHIKQEIRQI